MRQGEPRQTSPARLQSLHLSKETRPEILPPKWPTPPWRQAGGIRTEGRPAVQVSSWVPVPRGLLCSSSSFSYTFSSTRRDCSSLSFCDSCCCLSFASSCILKRPQCPGSGEVGSPAGALLEPHKAAGECGQEGQAGWRVPVPAAIFWEPLWPSAVHRSPHTIFTDTLEGACYLTLNSWL